MEKEMNPNPNNPDDLENGSDSEEEEEARHPLENQFVSMFPLTPRRYIRNRLANIPHNNPDAIARLTEELLRNPTPKVGDWNDAENDEAEEEVEEWKKIKLIEMRSLFPDRCPDWLRGNLNDIAVITRGVAGNNMFEEMENQFNRKVEEIFSLSDAERALLPTLKDWTSRRQWQEELEMWSIRITAQDMVDLYEDPVANFYSMDRKPESNLYREHSLAGLRDEFRYQNAQQIGKVFRRSRFLFSPARRFLLLGANTRKTRRLDNDVGYPAAPCMAFIRERRFCQLEEEITREMERRRLDREQVMMEALAAGLLEECAICLAPDCLPAEMVTCQAGHRFCRRCVVISAEGVLATGKGVVRCLGKCEMEMEVDQLQRVLKPNLISKLVVIRQAEELTAAGLENLVSCPYCPYQTIMDNLEDKVVRCLNPECGRDSCRVCKLSNHIPYSCKEYKEEVLDVSRRKVEEELTMSWVRQCWNCKVGFERIGGCNLMTCPKCSKKTCYSCRKPVMTGHICINIACRRLAYYTNNAELHEKELNKTEEKIKAELKEDEQEVMKDLFKPGTSKQ